MPDEIDKSQQYEENFLDSAISSVRADIPKGEPGYCGKCDEESPRLVGGCCVACRELDETNSRGMR